MLKGSLTGLYLASTVQCQALQDHGGWCTARQTWASGRGMIDSDVFTYLYTEGSGFRLSIGNGTERRSLSERSVNVRLRGREDAGGDISLPWCGDLLIMSQ